MGPGFVDFTADGEHVIIRKKVYKELVEDQKLMIALQNAGVDNWDGYAVAMEAYEEDE